jgi:broad specificity phosphatase PhoE
MKMRLSDIVTCQQTCPTPPKSRVLKPRCHMTRLLCHLTCRGPWTRRAPSKAVAPACPTVWDCANLILAHGTPPQGESWNTAAARVTADIIALTAQNPRRNIIAVAHFGAILSQVAQAAGIAPYRALSHRIDNYSVTEIQMHPTWGVARINHIP